MGMRIGRINGRKMVARDKNIRRKKVRELMRNGRERWKDEEHEEIRKARRAKRRWLWGEEDEECLDE